MTKKIEDLLVISDLDNTLLTAKEGIPDYNLQMIKEFQSLGGKFTVATGRSVESVSKYLNQVQLTAPAITYNGGVIYDFAQNQILSRHLLPDSAKDVLNIILDKFPDVGCEIMCDNFRTYIVSGNDYTYWHVTDEKLSHIITGVSNIKNKWIKVLFADDNSTLLKMQEFCRGLNCPEIEFVMTNSIYFEMMPKGISKGKALKDLCAVTGVTRENTVVVGDYYNDIEILQNAGLSVCVDNAPDDVKKYCQITVPCCTDGGVGHLLAQIINSYTQGG